jgi:hypothetical protein
MLGTELGLGLSPPMTVFYLREAIFPCIFSQPFPSASSQDGLAFLVK